jgi:hypothetical protein
MSRPLIFAIAAAAGVWTLTAPAARATTVNVGPGDSYDKIEGAKPGDEVLIAPGTYTFRVYLTQAAPADQPIVIRAQDPTNPPVWDLSAGLVEDAPGSYTAGDRGRGCWQLSGATNIQISDLVITGCHNQGANSAGLRYYNGSVGIVLSNLVFRGNDNGLTGGTQSSDITVEYCEFDANGTLLASASAPSHNIYIYGGTFALRYSYAHDPVQGQNFHIRAQQSVLEYNWFSRAKSYAGDLMTDDDDDGSGPFTQSMTFRGNVIVQGSTQANASQIIAVYNDAGVAGLTLRVTLLYNTFVGPSGGHAALVHLSNADGTTMSAELDDNLLTGTTAATAVEDSTHGTVVGTHNWLPTGASAAGLAATVFGNDPGLTNAAQDDFRPAARSSAVGAALAPASGAPEREYYRDETTARMYRLRATVNDIGAFESTTSGAGIGPGAAGAADGGGGAATGASGSGGAGGSGTGGGGSTGARDAGGGGPSKNAGCSCCAAPDGLLGWLEILLAVSALAALLARRRGASRRAGRRPPFIRRR